MTPRPQIRQSERGDRRECGHPADDGSGRICRRICAPGRDYHGGGHWYADPGLDGEYVRHATARWIVSGEQPASGPLGNDHPVALARRLLDALNTEEVEQARDLYAKLGEALDG